MIKNCPSCWREIKFEEKYARILVCPYCNSILEFWTWELTKIWEQTEFIEFPSIFSVWKKFKINWKEFFIKWQLRYEYDWWFFDKFFVTFNGEEFYIREDDGVITLTKEEDWVKSDFEIKEEYVWNTIDLYWRKLFVQEIWEFSLVSMKWYIWNHLIVWKKYKYLDAIVDWKILYIEKIIKENKIRFSVEIEKINQKDIIFY